MKRSARAPTDAHLQLQRRIFSLPVDAAEWARPRPRARPPSGTRPDARRPSLHVAAGRCPELEPAPRGCRTWRRSTRGPPPLTRLSQQSGVSRSGPRISVAHTATCLARKRARFRRASMRSTMHTAERERTHHPRGGYSRSHPEKSSPRPGGSCARSVSSRSRPKSRSRPPSVER